MAKVRRKSRVTPRLVRDDGYDQPAITFLHVLAVGLDLALRESKITDTKTRRKVVEEFSWGAAEFLDSQWLQTGDGRRHFPVVCFADQHPDEDPKVLRMPADVFSLHEMIAGVFDEVTNKGKGPYAVTIGDLGDEEPIDLEAD